MSISAKKAIVLGVIPARGGSKGVPHKNIRPVLGKPLIHYSIECALQSPHLDRLLVSTDSPAIAETARKAGAETPFIRPPHLAEDATPMMPVLEHAIKEAERIYKTVIKCIVLLDPTGPLRAPEDIESCLRIFEESRCDAVISANKAHRNPYFNMVCRKNGTIRLVNKAKTDIGRRQDAPEVFDLNTLIWIYSRQAVLKERSRIPKKSVLYLVEPERAVDLDTESDFKILEALMKDNYASAKLRKAI